MPANLTTRFRSEVLRHRWLTLLALALFMSIASQAQSGPAAKFPEECFISSEKYTNAYFGFALTIPKVRNASPLLPKMSSGVHTLFGVRGWGPPPGMSFLLV